MLARWLPGSALVVSLGSFVLVAGCGTSEAGRRPVPRLTAADRVADPSCAATWIAAVTARVEDLDGRPIAGAQLAPCVRLGDGTSSCLLPVESDRDGWAVWQVEPTMRCLERVALRVLAPGPGQAATYQTLPMTPVDAVLDVAEPIVVVRTSPALSTDPMTDPTRPHTARFAGDVSITVRPDALSSPEDFPQLGLVAIAGLDAPAFMHQAGEPDLVLALSPDADLLDPATLSLPAPGGARDGTSFDVMVLGGLYTPLADGTVVEEGTLRPFARVTVSGGRLEVRNVPRLGWLAFVRRG